MAPSIQAFVLKESVLLQLADISHNEYDASAQPALAAAAAAAHSVLLLACASPHHGLLAREEHALYTSVPAKGGTPALHAGAAEAYELHSTLHATSAPVLAPSKALLALLRKLRFQSSVRHLQLLVEVRTCALSHCTPPWPSLDIEPLIPLPA